MLIKLTTGALGPLSLLVVQLLQHPTRQYVQFPEGLLCPPAQSQKHMGDSRRWVVTLGELKRVVESP